VILDASLISDIDASAEVALREVIGGPRERNIEPHVARATAELQLRFDDVDLTDVIGADRFHGSVTAAVDACRVAPDLPETDQRSAVQLEGFAWCLQALAVPEGVGARWEVVHSTHDLVAVLLVQGLGLESVGEVNGLRAPARGRLCFGGHQELGGKPVAAKIRPHPEALQLAAVAPCPSSDTGDDLAAFAHEDRQVDFFAETHRDGRLTTDLRFEDFEVGRFRVGLDLEVHPS
jgi:hypothetical protein